MSNQNCHNSKPFAAAATAASSASPRACSGGCSHAMVWIMVWIISTAQEAGTAVAGEPPMSSHAERQSRTNPSLSHLSPILSDSNRKPTSSQPPPPCLGLPPSLLFEAGEPPRVENFSRDGAPSQDPCVVRAQTSSGTTVRNLRVPKQPRSQLNTIVCSICVVL